ncbi:MAG: basic amino acid ABC transporter substrate-binding protein [Eubacteriales bacterium]|nr:basic amino acid ABC transporter substrate-binding protein [Eubacteriales bacterium]
MKKVLLSIIISLVVILSIVGCSNTSTQKKLVMATNAEFQPYEYKEGNEIVGIDVEIAKAIAQKLGMELEIMDINFDAIIPSVINGKADIGAAGMTITEDRLTQVDFSDSYTKAVQSVIIKENSNIKSLDDLNNKLIGVQQGTTGDIYATSDYGDEYIQRFKTGADAVAALISNKIDAVIIDNEPAKSYVKANNGIKIMDSAYAEEDYAIAVQKGNNELLSKINETISELKNSGTFDSIIAKYIHD